MNRPYRGQPLAACYPNPGHGQIGLLETAGVDGRPHLHKEYITPAGTLYTVVREDAEWPYGDDVPFLDDYLCTRSEKFLIDAWREHRDLP